MATTAESAPEGASRNHWPWIDGGARLAIATLAVVASVAAAVVGWHGGAATRLSWLVLALVWLTAAFAIRADYERRGAERTQMLAVALTLAVATEVVVLASMLHLLVGWPPRLFQVAACATVPIAVAAAIRIPTRFEARVARLVALAISVAGLTALVAGIYLLVVVGLGRPPRHEERTLLVLSIVATAISTSRARMIQRMMFTPTGSPWVSNPIAAATNSTRSAVGSRILPSSLPWS